MLQGSPTPVTDGLLSHGLVAFSSTTGFTVGGAASRLPFSSPAPGSAGADQADFGPNRITFSYKTPDSQRYTISPASITIKLLFVSDICSSDIY